MRLLGVVRCAFLALIVPAVLSTLWLYLYPVVQNCHFSASQQHGIAPFRLLALGDPQLEGDTSLPDPNAPLFPGLVGLRHRLWTEPLDIAARTLRRTVKDIVTRDIPRLVQTERKKLDLLGNDYYLAHIYRSTKWWTQPTHVSVLGDLLGSQWISNDEFDRRADRFWNRVFAGAHFWRHDTPEEELGGTPVWDFVDNLNASQTPALLNVAGNHDIGYAGDIDHHRIHRFERAFGQVNWRIRIPFSNLTSNLTTQLHLVNLNSMNLDNPAWNQDLYHATHDYLDSVIDDTGARDPRDAVVLLTHVPLYKPAGVCVDPPFFSYFEPHHGGGIREQNHLSRESSEKILNGLFRLPSGSKRAGIVLNGHDHEGCDTWHDRIDTEQEQWNSTRFLAPNTTTNGIREVTVRSMMGDYGGNAGLLSAWFDANDGMWKFEYATCALGKQHIWWAIHVIDLVVIILGIAYSMLQLLDLIRPSKPVFNTEKKNK
ncbi:unnamed protein product [Aureobasidium mustum]|uniref:Calcineurin-like phosphoesterase domain-containing protein n=1 Tax=Aureobasidium mustum TaxID=2773714 RepID=A0A9N8K206_9PEZI|nr:unnamed protein product [Aureobasidium mustum]